MWLAIRKLTETAHTMAFDQTVNLVHRIKCLAQISVHLEDLRVTGVFDIEIFISTFIAHFFLRECKACRYDLHK